MNHRTTAPPLEMADIPSDIARLGRGYRRDLPDASRPDLVGLGERWTSLPRTASYPADGNALRRDDSGGGAADARHGPSIRTISRPTVSLSMKVPPSVPILRASPSSRTRMILRPVVAMATTAPSAQRHTRCSGTARRSTGHGDVLVTWTRGRWRCPRGGRRGRAGHRDRAFRRGERRRSRCCRLSGSLPHAARPTARRDTNTTNRGMACLVPRSPTASAFTLLGEALLSISSTLSPSDPGLCGPAGVPPYLHADPPSGPVPECYVLVTSVKAESGSQITVGVRGPRDTTLLQPRRCAGGVEE